MGGIATLLRLMDCLPFKGRLSGPEDRLAIEVANFLRAATLEAKLGATWTSIPHEAGGKSRKSAGFGQAVASYAKMKAHGMITGSTDYVFVWPDGGGWIELKAPDGSLSPSQKDFRDWCHARGSRWKLCRSLDEVATTLRDWGVLSK